MLYYRPPFFTPAFWIIFGQLWEAFSWPFSDYTTAVYAKEREDGESERLVSDFEDKYDADSYEPTPISRFTLTAAAVASKSNYLWYIKSSSL